MVQTRGNKNKQSSGLPKPQTPGPKAAKRRRRKTKTPPKVQQQPQAEKIKDNTPSQAQQNLVNSFEDPTQSCPCKQEIKSKYIECSKCEQWWHQECLGLNTSTFNKLAKSYYLCPICSIKNLKPDTRIFHKLSDVLQDFGIAHTAKPNPTTTPINEACDHNNEEVTELSGIVIIDKIAKPTNFTNSSDILREVNRHKPQVEASLAYPLAGGGIAIHCKSKESTNLALEDWPKGAFDSDVVSPHPPAALNTEQTVVVRSVSTKLATSKIESAITKELQTQVKVHRLHNRVTGDPFPIIKVTTNKTVATSLIQNGITFLNNKYCCEPLHRTKIIRCYHCQHFGHCASSCKYKAACRNCAGSHPHSDLCTLPPKCVNCEGSHSSDHKCCPVFKALVKRIKTTHGN